MTLLLLLSGVILIASLYGIINAWRTSRKDPRLALFVVMGDVDHSPRMAAHTSAFKKTFPDASVILCGYGDPSERQKDVLCFQKCPRDAGVLRRVLFDSLTVAKLMLFSIPAIPALIVVQNPPCIPLIPLLVLYSRLAKSKLVVDWHNLGHSQLSLRQLHESQIRSPIDDEDSGQNFLVGLYYLIETFCGQYADHNICVSEMMRAWLAENGVTRCEVFYDRPRAAFSSLSFLSRSEKLDRLAEIVSSETDFVDLSANIRRHNHFIVLTSTSWSLDEPFDLLYEALLLYEKSSDPEKRPVCCLATGKGSMKQLWKERNEMDRRNGLTEIKINFAWCSESDYAKLLPICDIGVCLHDSASGMDLPMKVLDMIGAGIRVLAMDYGPCLDELRNQYGESQIIPFEPDAQKLCCALLKAATTAPPFKRTKNIKRFDDEWTNVMEPLVSELCPSLKESETSH